jgi:ABC-type multidrug transport system fused ATPase/permease subunit
MQILLPTPGLVKSYKSMSDNKKSQNMRRVASLALPYWRELSVGMIFLLGGSGINLLFPEIIRRLLDSSNFNYLVDNLSLVILGLTGLIIAQGLCFYGRSYIFGFVGHKAVAGLRKQLYAALVGQDVEFFDKNRAGDLVSRLASDTVLLQTAVSLNISVLIRYSIQVLVGIALMAWISVTLTLVLILILPILVGISAVLGKKLKSASKKMQEELGRANMIAEETLYGVRTVKAFAQERNEGARYGQAIDATLAMAKIRAWIAAFFASFSSVLMNLAIVLVLGFGIYLLKLGTISMGSLTAFLLYGVIVAISFAFIASTYSEFAQSLGAAERVFEIIDHKPKIEESSKYTQSNVTKGEVQFSQVSFAYPTRPEKHVLKNISFALSSGESLALVGPSGSGKTTIINLLLSFYKPESGNIKIDGVDIASLRPSDFRNEMALVAQDPEIFSVTIEEILRYGKPSASESELKAACKDANIIEFIESLPNKFQTHVGDKGVQLSGGQRQRLAIARAILKNPKILILDEATSALDSANESLIQEALERIMRGRTTIVIAHRLSTVKNVDSIIVLKDGEIIEQGNHTDLINRGGLYRELVDKQELRS